MNWLINLLGGYTRDEVNEHLAAQRSVMDEYTKTVLAKCAKLEQTLNARDAELHDLTVMLAKERDDLNELAGEKATLETRCERLKEELDVADKQFAEVSKRKYRMRAEVVELHKDDSKKVTGLRLDLVFEDNNGKEHRYDVRGLAPSSKNRAELTRVAAGVNYIVKCLVADAEPGAIPA